MEDTKIIKALKAAQGGDITPILDALHDVTLHRDQFRDWWVGCREELRDTQEELAELRERADRQSDAEVLASHFLAISKLAEEHEEAVVGVRRMADGQYSAHVRAGATIHGSHVSESAEGALRGAIFHAEDVTK